MTSHAQSDSTGVPKRISIVVLTHSRCHLLRQCVENVLSRTSEHTSEILIWNNASTDNTREYLDSLTDARIRVIHHEKNIGVDAYARAFRQTLGEYLIEVDDDVIDAPPRWDATLLSAFEKLPTIGYLAANLANNPHDVAATVMYGINADRYRIETVNGVQLKIGGPVGGGCSMTSRELHDLAGGWTETGKPFWQEEGDYLSRLGQLGYRAAYLDALQVVHAGGPHYSKTPAEKLAYWRKYNRRVARRNAVKRVLLLVPPVRVLNQRYDWFRPPAVGPDYVELYS